MLQAFTFCFNLIVLCQSMPVGDFHPLRERTFDLIHLRADLDLMIPSKSLTGSVSLKIQPLHKINVVDLDAISLEIDSVSLGGELCLFENDAHKLYVHLAREFASKEVLELTIKYHCTPKSGLFFQPFGSKGDVHVSTWGEGGLHANWLPLYNDVNDKFSTEMVITVPSTYKVVSNGALQSVTSSEKGLTYHWRQEKPHSNYLISINAGPLIETPLLNDGAVPMSVWAPAGFEVQANYTFRNTGKMLDFFSKSFDFPYSWEKYDQVLIPAFPAGAMEHTSITGHDMCMLRNEADPIEFWPTHEEISSEWSAEAIIAHELAHHWFGNNVTCRSLGSIWLNESFATFCQYLWLGHQYSEDDENYYRDLAERHYSDYTKQSLNIRPLEYYYYNNRDEIFDVPITYLKGSLVLENLKNLLGEDVLFRSLQKYLKRFQFDGGTSQGFQTILENESGLNLDHYFQQWVYGGGHPTLSVSYKYNKEKHLLELSVSQLHPIVEGQGVFDFSADVGIETQGKKWVERLSFGSSQFSVLVPCPEVPLMVSFDSNGYLIADIIFPKSFEELSFQVQHDKLAGKLWALDQLCASYSSHSDILPLFKKLLSEDSFWGFKAAVAQKLGELSVKEAQLLVSDVLKNGDYHARKGAVLALVKIGNAEAIQVLRDVVSSDLNSAVVSTAIVGLSKIDLSLEMDLLLKQINRKSWSNEITVACLTAFLNRGNPDISPQLWTYLEEPNNIYVKQAALNALIGLVPSDPKLHEKLMLVADSNIFGLQMIAIAGIGVLDVKSGEAVLTSIVQRRADTNLVSAAESAIDQLHRFDD